MTSKCSNNHRRAVAKMIHAEAGVSKLVSNSGPGSSVHRKVDELEGKKRVFRRDLRAVHTISTNRLLSACLCVHWVKRLRKGGFCF